MPTDFDAASQVLAEFTVPKTPGLFVIGSLHRRRVTFLSQQLRALNCVWAALTTRQIRAADTVAVVGGGLAGMTVTAALGQKGIRTSLFEKPTALMRAQRAN